MTARKEWLRIVRDTAAGLSHLSRCSRRGADLVEQLPSSRETWAKQIRNGSKRLPALAGYVMPTAKTIESRGLHHPSAVDALRHACAAWRDLAGALEVDHREASALVRELAASLTHLEIERLRIEAEREVAHAKLPAKPKPGGKREQNKARLIEELRQAIERTPNWDAMDQEAQAKAYGHSVPTLVKYHRELLESE